LYPTLHAFEIALRNSISHALKDYFGSSWLFTDSAILQQQERVEVASAINRLRLTEFPPGKLIAELNFGFWIGLFKKYYRKVI